MSAIKLATPSSGSISLSPADTASDLTITVPAVTGTMLTTASAGTVLQVVQGVYATQTSTTSNTYTDTGLTATITPKFSTSKILAIVSQNGCTNGGSIYSAINLLLARNATTLILEDSIGYSGNSLPSFKAGFISFSYLDSPSTTSATTYKTQMAMQVGGAGTVYTQQNGVTSTIILMEIAG